MAKQRTTTRKQKKQPAAPALVFHGQTADGVDVVMIDKLRVALVRDGETWVAQGLEIDYAAEGNTIDDAKAQFGRGLMLTLRENIRIFGGIEHVLRPVPPDIWHVFMASNVLRQTHSQVSAHQVRRLWRTVAVPGEIETAPPIGVIDYYVQKQSAASA